MKCAGGAADELLLGCWLEPKFGSPAASPPPSAHELLDSLLAPPADLKPLPPFTGYTGHLSINGISGHHYHAIAQRLPEENNNYPPAFPDHDVVSSTCAEPADLSDVKPFLQTEFPAPDSCARSPPAKYDVSSIEDLAAIIGHAIGPSAEAERADSRDSWLDIDSWFSSQHADKLPPELEFGPGSPPAPDFPPCKAAEYKAPEPSKAQGSTLQSLLTHGYMPLLQSRLQGAVKQEAGYPEGVSAGSPPGTVSTTEGLALGGRYAPYGLGLKQEALCPERLVYGAAHTTTGGRKRSRAKPRPAHSSPQFAPPELGLLGKEKPVHRCGICNRGFLNKSNIKVHLRTHTGEKPFRCDVCAKAFRQKAHLIKHQQIHKRIGRD